MTQSTRDMCIRFAVLSIGNWRSAKAKGLPRSAATSRREALWWLAQAKQ